MKKIAYLILAHNDPIHLEKLIGKINFSCDIYIHIDNKTPLDLFSKITLKENIFFCKNRISVSWGGISMIQAQLELINCALNSQIDYSHLVFLSGSDYPIKPIKYIYNFFTENADKEYIKYIDMRESPEHYLRQIKFKWFNEPILKKEFNNYGVYLDKGVRKILTLLRLRNKWDENLIPYFGSQWCALTLQSAKYIVFFLKNNPNFWNINKYSFSPDEHFFHTIIGNSCFASHASGLQKYKGRGTWRLANFHLIDSSLSKWFSVDDFEEIAKSDMLFVRKVRSSDGSKLVDKINSKLL